MLLCDSGGHYFDGTTDTTRTVHLGKPNELEMEMYTRVLRGHLDYQSVIFPGNKKYTVKDIDILARHSLYKTGKDYKHGTGHHVGHFLNVHEGPSGKTLKPGYIITNEPGYYLSGHFGIRIENIMWCQPHPVHPDFLHFEPMTVYPYALNLINSALLLPDHIDQINQYHNSVAKTVMPLLNSKFKQITKVLFKFLK